MGLSATRWWFYIYQLEIALNQCSDPGMSSSELPLALAGQDEARQCKVVAAMSHVTEMQRGAPGVLTLSSSSLPAFELRSKMR